MTAQKALRAATAAIVLGALVGVALIAAPFLLEYQAAGGEWVRPTKHQVITGAAVTGSLVLSLWSMLSARLRGWPARSRVGE